MFKTIEALDHSTHQDLELAKIENQDNQSVLRFDSEPNPFKLIMEVPSLKNLSVKVVN